MTTDRDHAHLAAELRRMAEDKHARAAYYRDGCTAGEMPLHLADILERDACTLLAAAEAIDELKKACDLHCSTHEVNMASITQVRCELVQLRQQAAADAKRIGDLLKLIAEVPELFRMQDIDMNEDYDLDDWNNRRKAVVHD